MIGYRCETKLHRLGVCQFVDSFSFLLIIISVVLLNALYLLN